MLPQITASRQQRAISGKDELVVHLIVDKRVVVVRMSSNYLQNYIQFLRLPYYCNLLYCLSLS